MEFCSMGMITEKEIGRFYAEDDMGNRYTVVRWQDKIVFRPSSGSVRRIPGKVRHSLVTGEQLDSRADGSLVIVNDDRVILILLETEDIGDQVIRPSLREDEVGHIPMG